MGTFGTMEERARWDQDGEKGVVRERQLPIHSSLTNALNTMCLSTSADTIAGPHHSMNKRKASSPIPNLRAPTNFAAQANLAIVKTYS